MITVKARQMEKQIVKNNKVNLSDIKTICIITLLGTPSTIVCASILIILNYANNNKPFLNVLGIVLYSLIPVAVMLFIALTVFIAMKCVDRSAKSKDKNALQKTQEDLQQELKQKRQMIIDEAFNAISISDVVESTSEEMTEFKKDLIRAICGGIHYIHRFYSEHMIHSQMDVVKHYNDLTTIIVTPFRGVIPLDLAIKLVDHDVVRFMLAGEPNSVVSRNGDGGVYIIKLSKEYGDHKMQEIIREKCQLFKEEREKQEIKLQERLKSQHICHINEEKSTYETDNPEQHVSLAEVSDFSPENENLSLA